MKFNKEEIALCKKIAEKHRREIELDDKLCWKDKIVTVETISTTPENLDIYSVSVGYVVPADDDFFFLWQISDCLEFLRERGYHARRTESYQTHFHLKIKKQGEMWREFDGIKEEDVYLKAVLAIVGEKS